MNNTKTYRIKGMHCASCASIIEKTFKKTEGVEGAEVNYGTETAKLSYDASKTNPRELSKKIEPLGYSLDLREDAPAGPGPSAEDMGLPAGQAGMSEDEHA